MRQIQHIALQGRPGSIDYVKTFYLKYGDDGQDFNSYGQNATVPYKVCLVTNKDFFEAECSHVVTQACSHAAL